MKILAFAASLRDQSFNRRLLELAIARARAAGAEVDDAKFAEFDMPLYDEDCEQTDGFPPGAEELKRRLEAVDALIIASPEYNYSTPGALKNAIDWVSRYTPTPLRGKHLLLMSASRSLVGGNRGLWATRVPFETLGTFVYPGMFSLAQAHNAFGEGGKLADPALQERLDGLVDAFVEFASRRPA